MVIVHRPIVKTFANTTVWTIVAIGSYELIKWGIATVLAPETGGLSYVVAASAP
jgi:hypothetical protein